MSKSEHTFRDQTIFGIGFPDARHSSLMDAPLATSTLVDGVMKSIFGGTIRK